MRLIIGTLIILVVFMWEMIFLPRRAELKITERVSNMGGRVKSMQSLSSRDSLYLVEYTYENKIIKANVKYDFWGNIKEWI